MNKPQHATHTAMITKPTANLQKSKESELWALIDKIESKSQVKKAATSLDRKSYLVALGLTDAAAEAYIENLAMHSDDVFLSIVAYVAESIKSQRAQAAVDKTTEILKAKYLKQL